MSVGAYRSRFGLGVGWYFCRCAIGFVIGAGGLALGCYVVVILRLFFSHTFCAYFDPV